MLAAAFITCAHAQETKTDPAQAAMAEFYDCTKKYSEKYSKSREPAQDIADAALSYCEGPRERARTLLIDKLSAGGRSARDQVNSLFPGVIEKARLLSIRTIVEARYEASLRAATVAPVAPAQPIVPAPLPPASSSAAPPSAAPAIPPVPALRAPPSVASPAPSVAPTPPAPAPAPLQAAPRPQPPPAISAAAPSMKPDEAVAIPYIDSTLPPPPAGGAATPRPDPGGFPPEIAR